MLKQECSMLKQEYINVKTGMDPMLSKCSNRNESNVKTGMNPVLKQEWIKSNQSNLLSIIGIMLQAKWTGKQLYMYYAIYRKLKCIAKQPEENGKNQPIFSSIICMHFFTKQHS